MSILVFLLSVPIYLLSQSTKILSQNMSINFSCVDLELDLIVDTNSDGTINDLDDLQEDNIRGLIIDTNNANHCDSPVSVATPCFDNIINGEDDRMVLTPITIRYVPDPNGSDNNSIRLSVPENNYLRVFNHIDEAIIGPDEVGMGGPQIEEYIIPNDVFQGQEEVIFLLEGVSYGEGDIKLELINSSGDILIEDRVRIIVSMDGIVGQCEFDPRLPRDYISAFYDTPVPLTGIQANITYPESPLAWGNYVRGNGYSEVAYWLNMSPEQNVPDTWLQAGTIKRRIQSEVFDEPYEEIQEIYLEFSKDFTTGGTDEIYNIIRVEQNEWSEGLFKIEMDNETGQITAKLNGTVYAMGIYEVFTSVEFRTTTFSTEVFQSVNRNPGVATNKASVSECMYRTINNSWVNTNFTKYDAKITYCRWNGTKWVISAAAGENNTVEGKNYNLNWISGTHFEHWDSRDW